VSGVRQSVLCSYIWQESGFRCHEDFLYLIYFLKKFNMFCTFNVICKANATINGVTFQHKEGTFLSTLMDDNMLISKISRNQTLLSFILSSIIL
jgi:hypothetical protein